MAKKNVSLGSAMLNGITPIDTPAGNAAVRTSKPKLKGTVLERITIECTDNGGYSVDVHRSAASKGSGYGDSSYVKPTKHVFEDRNSLDDFLDHVLGTPDKSGK